ncbi:hypothetical protein, partial [Sphingobacterium sp.]|uniref:hypothetical protein n=1 Tax=Sphingobacterium sp. TaxID=341027 RepID=UPI00289ABD87
MQSLRNYIMPVVSVLLIQPVLGATTYHHLTNATYPKERQSGATVAIRQQTDRREIRINSDDPREKAVLNDKPQAENQEVFVRKGKICLNFTRRLIDKKIKGPFHIRRSKGRLGDYQTIAKVSQPKFMDQVLAGSPYDYYYEIQTEQGEFVARLGMELQLFGENTFIYSAADDKVRVGIEVNKLHDQMFGKEFSP